MSEDSLAAADDPRLLAAATALKNNEVGVAEPLLRKFLKDYPTDVHALQMYATVAVRLGRYEDAEKLFLRCQQLAPEFLSARYDYAVVLHHMNRAPEMLAQTEFLVKRAPHNPGFRSLHAAALVRVGEFGQAIELYERLLEDHPDQLKIWLSYGDALKAQGRPDDAIAAYRKCIALKSDFGEAYWGLANIKTFRFTPKDVEGIRAQLAQDGLADEDRTQLHFALGKALEDDALYAESFEHYDKGNALRHAAIFYDAEETTAHVRRSKALFTQEFFRARAGGGFPAPDPIFVVGLPRSGSTLIEQILSSHSAIEGTAELPEINALALRLGQRKRADEPSAYPEMLASLDSDALKRLGEDYLVRTRIQRRSDRPFFIDKMPRNFLHVGLIHTILPNAKVIDVRRNPLDCCFSCFKQYFARGHGFAYDLRELGRHYRDYVELMAHYDDVLPAHVHRVIYEELIENTEGEVRRLLSYCGVPFEEGCLRFYEASRAVRTPSSEQVRMPIFRDALGHWRNYEPWLAPLKTALGPVLEFYPDAPPPMAASHVEKR